jgi:hypothetical protein
MNENIGPTRILIEDVSDPVFDVTEFVREPYSADPAIQPRLKRSWVFRTVDFFTWATSTTFGIISIIFLLAVSANIPIVQFLAFGYLLEVTGRLARQQRYRDALIGLKKASKIGSVLLGAWLLLWPLRLASQYGLEAWIIDPDSVQQRWWRGFNFVLIALVIAHLFSATVCGGKLRYFFWPIVAPFSFAVWAARRIAGQPGLKGILNMTIGWLSPHLVNDICLAHPIGDWFLPAIIWRKLRTGRLFADARDGLWNFVTSLHLGYYWLLGLKGFVGTVAWLAIPTLLLVASTSLDEGSAFLAGFLGSLIAVPVFSILPFVQAHFAVDGKLRRFLEFRVVMRNMGHAPLAHLIALLLTLVLAVPLFLLKIERIPVELLWTLSIVFVLFTWPARWIVGWAYRRGAIGEKRRRWWIRYPIWMLLFAVSLSFVFVMFFTRYITWNGAWSLVENHVFLLPSPFWLEVIH